MKKVLVAGAGKVGALITALLNQCEDYQVHVLDMDFSGDDIQRVLAHYQDIHTTTLSVTDHAAVANYCQQHGIQALISSLPYFVNEDVARIAVDNQLHYFDLTEDTRVTQTVGQLAKNSQSACVPQCGLAPGFISIVANDLMQHFDELDSSMLRVGALPQYVNNALHYALTWSTEGVINEYGNQCHAIENGEFVNLQPLQALESIQLDGLSYEAFNTSGGLGSLAETYSGKINCLNYKTIRYPGHCEKMRVLMNDLKLNEDRPTLKKILENAIPKTYQDVVLIFVSVTGRKQGILSEETYMNKCYPRTIADLHWSAIQVTTASSMAAVVDCVLEQPERYQGLVKQEDFSLDDFLNNRFGQYYRS